MPTKRMLAPESGVAVRMYRLGHGDCFLLAFRRPDPTDPLYMLIDCGLMNGSQVDYGTEKEINTDSIRADIKAATNNHIHVVVVTHEHKDHVGGFRNDVFRNMTLDEVWLGWTEDPDHALAQSLRQDYNDTLLGLVGAARALSSSPSLDSKRRAERISDLLELDLEGDLPLSGYDGNLRAAVKGITNKKAIKILTDQAEKTRYLRPNAKPLELDGVEDVRVFVLGPPENRGLLESLDPRPGEGYHATFLRSESSFFSAAWNVADLPSPGTSNPGDAEIEFEDDPDEVNDEKSVQEALNASSNEASDASVDDELNGAEDPAAAVEGEEVAAEETAPHEEENRDPWSPFDARHRLHVGKRMSRKHDQFFRHWYGFGDDHAHSWRSIEQDWLFKAEDLALRLNNYTNNTCLVLAIELRGTGKVLLFVGDAQRGNWVSWGDLAWDESTGLETGEEIDTKDLLARTVFYKVGHHGSHNATLKAEGLESMAKGEYAKEFVAMIPANSEWAYGKKHPWRHPLRTLRRAVLRKTRGRVLQTDKGRVRRPKGVSTAEWQRFKNRLRVKRLYFEVDVVDE